MSLLSTSEHVGFAYGIKLSNDLKLYVGAGLAHEYVRLMASWTNPLDKEQTKSLESGIFAFGFGLYGNLDYKLSKKFALSLTVHPDFMIVSGDHIANSTSTVHDKTVASDSQIMFLVLNASGLTLIPVSIMTYRAQLGAANPSDVFLPLLLSTFFSTIAGIFALSFFQKIKLKDPVTVMWLGGISACVIAVMFYFSHLTAEALGTTSLFISGLVLFGVIVAWRPRHDDRRHEEPWPG